MDYREDWGRRGLGYIHHHLHFRTAEQLSALGEVELYVDAVKWSLRTPYNEAKHYKDSLHVPEISIIAGSVMRLEGDEGEEVFLRLIGRINELRSCGPVAKHGELLVCRRGAYGNRIGVLGVPEELARREVARSEISDAYWDAYPVLDHEHLGSYRGPSYGTTGFGWAWVPATKSLTVVGAMETRFFETAGIPKRFSHALARTAEELRSVFVQPNYQSPPQSPAGDWPHYE